MLTRHASPAMRAWKYGLAAPVCALLFLFACQKTTPERGIAEAPEAVGAGELSGKKDMYDLSEVEEMPQFPGGQDALIRFLSENIRYPDAARSTAAEGTAVIVFVVNEDGSITDVEGIKTGQSGWRQDFQDEAVRVVESMPDWEPAFSKGKSVKVKLTLPVRFKLR